MNWKRTLTAAGLVAVLAACGGSGDDSAATTEATAGITATTAAPESTTTSAPAPETTMAPDTTTAPAGGSTANMDEIRKAMASSAEAIPSRVEGTMTLTGVADGEGPAEVVMPFSMLTDPATGNTSMSFDFGAMAGAMGGEEIPPEMAGLMGDMEVREIDGTTYLKFAFFTAFMGAETEWVSMPTEGDDVVADMGSGAAPSDPSAYLESLSEAGGTAEELGTEEIRGVTTTHYRIFLDEDWRDQLSAEDLARLDDQVELPEGGFPIDLWIDGDGLVHRMSMEMSAAEIEDADDTFESMRMTFDFSAFGEEVVIEPPPADQVTDVSDLAGGFFGGETSP